MRVREGTVRHAYLSNLLLLPDLVVGGSSLPLGDARSAALFYQPHGITLGRRAEEERERGGQGSASYTEVHIWVCI